MDYHEFPSAMIRAIRYNGSRGDNFGLIILQNGNPECFVSFNGDVPGKDGVSLFQKLGMPGFVYEKYLAFAQTTGDNLYFLTDSAKKSA
jgi:hypothetical protein